jgi:Flp pilus assembly protein TadG
MQTAALRAARRSRPDLLRRFARARRAAAPVEFALLAPLVALASAGLPEPGGALTAGRAAPAVASTIGDLAAQAAAQTAQALE